MAQRSSKRRSFDLRTNILSTEILSTTHALAAESIDFPIGAKNDGIKYPKWKTRSAKNRNDAVLQGCEAHSTCKPKCQFEEMTCWIT